MDSIPSMRYFKERTTQFVLELSSAKEEQVDEALEQIDWYIDKTGGWENHYRLMFEGLCNGFSFEEQLKQSEVIWQMIKSRFNP